MNKPDILVRMPFDSYGEIADYIKGAEISEIGRKLMKEAADKMEYIEAAQYRDEMMKLQELLQNKK